MILIGHKTQAEGDWGTVRDDLVSALSVAGNSLKRACCVPKSFLSLPKESRWKKHEAYINQGQKEY